MVVPSGCWVRNAGSDDNNKRNSKDLSSGDAADDEMSAKGILICRDNSHVFQERTLNLKLPVKIGRSVAKARAANNNAIFDCKVLSRNHALLWYSAGKFYLQDTRSSNGTFVNNQRLSATGLESTPREVCSGDIVQFGVDVMESTKKVTHGCIVARLKIYLPDGTEAKASRSMSVSSPAGDVSLEDLYKLHQYVQEASRREKSLHGKLAHLQNLVESTRKATEQSWKALIDEDRLLSQVKTVESQLDACSKNMTEDKIRNELVKLEEEKAHYQVVAKEALRKIHEEKLEVTQKLVQLESRLNETEEECQSLHDVSKQAQSEVHELAVKYGEALRNLQFIENKLVKKEESYSEMVKLATQEKKDLLKTVEEQIKIERLLQARWQNCFIGNLANIPKHITAMRNYMQTLLDMNPKLLSEADVTSKAGVNPIEAIYDILYKVEDMLEERINTAEVTDTNLSNSDQRQNRVESQSIEQLRMIIANAVEGAADKNELDDSPNKRENSSDYIAQPALDSTERKRGQRRDYQSRRTLVNGGTNLDDGLESDGNSELADETCSIGSDETWSSSVDEAAEKSVIETKDVEDEPPVEDEESPPQKLEVRFASGENGKDLEEVHYDHSYRPEEEFADVATAAGDDDSSDSMESPNESLASSVASRERDEKDEDVDKVENDESEREECEGEHLEGDYVKTLKPLSNATNQSSLHTREYVLRTLISSLESLGGEDDLEARQVVKRELDELRDWLVQESSESIVDKLKELYYRAKNEDQRIQEVNEELVILKEKYNVLAEEKTELQRRYKTLKAQCGDLLNASYSVPIQYVAPIAVALVWMLLEKMF